MTVEIPVLKKRVVTAAVLVLIIAVFLLFAAYTCSGRFALSLLAFLLSTVCAYEFTDFSISKPELAPGQQMLHRLPYFAAIIMPSAICLAWIFTRQNCGSPSGSALLGMAAAGLIFSNAILTYLLLMAGRRSLESCTHLVRELPLAVILIGIGGAALQGLAWLEQGVSPIVWFILVVCINDIAAFFGGSSIGGPKLSPALSPAKTLSGSLCGAAAGILTGVICRALIDIEISAGQAVILSLVIVVLAQTGDLAKSYLKRLHEIKDSSQILPGHGGVFDRMDAMLAAAPFFYICCALVLR